MAWRARRVHSGEHGAVAAELVIATPLLLLALLAIIQFALWSHATHVAQAAAAEALAAARVQNGTAAAGNAAGRQLLDQLAQGPLRSSQIDVERTATSASASVRGEVVAVLPGVHLHVHAETAGEVERFVPDVSGFANSGAVSGGNLSGGGR
ncbi:pilus assembly protein TadE [Amycolatopsis balhimycina DSM 5908]|uniref:Pilus assembly protein TadE n=1 Tax=Amycolatopsis balhimycina DSM 5908 TaxID=1081091 RepID=A0A428W446_AMYBA|nr:TadE/TadG family type IV pilus assembly protein [Amycolatopsis balhimycina]RSM37861.1 pilus assembly protein TadE [Amycolatopsis balhimycina DSM 5908]